MDGAGDEEQKHAAGCEYVKQLLLTVSSMASGLNNGLMRYVTRPIAFAVKAPWKMLTVVPGFSAMKQPVEAFFMSSTDASTHAPRPKRRGVLGGSELKPGACACLACCRRALQRRRARLARQRCLRRSYAAPARDSTRSSQTLKLAATGTRACPPPPCCPELPAHSRVWSARSTHACRSRRHAGGRS